MLESVRTAMEVLYQGPLYALCVSNARHDHNLASSAEFMQGFQGFMKKNYPAITRGIARTPDDKEMIFSLAHAQLKGPDCCFENLLPEPSFVVKYYAGAPCSLFKPIEASLHWRVGDEHPAFLLLERSDDAPGLKFLCVDSDAPQRIEHLLQGMMRPRVTARHNGFLLEDRSSGIVAPFSYFGSFGQEVARFTGEKILREYRVYASSPRMIPAPLQNPLAAYARGL